ncbi:uncharacterized protein LOC108199149 isoform X1 [Daucus carota subsp. sativus]|uniref:uncharacterized protein LOC108199149 isoform X1 n=1 Tax=Daucus carota subsp. sativus TaxID=79200 RepID=UPI0007EF3678|nr:PREDICTED: uncharacterized protein LOC108199149 isoform X1 [Daucus carota subsp. sativus]
MKIGINQRDWNVKPFMTAVLRSSRDTIYAYPEDSDPAEGDRAVKEFVKKNWKNLPYQEKKRAEQSAVYARRGGLKTATRRSFRPRYFSQRIWDNLNSYWGSDLFKKRSDNAKKARAQVEHIHHSGAKPFSERRELYYLSELVLKRHQ